MIKRWACTRCRANGIWETRSREQCVCGGYLAEWRPGLEFQPPETMAHPKLGSRVVVPEKVAHKRRSTRRRKGKAKRGPNGRYCHPMPEGWHELSFDWDTVGSGDPT